MIVKLNFRPCELQLTNPWKIASSEGSSMHRVIIVELLDEDGVRSFGEAAPSSLYGENIETATALFKKIDPRRLSFTDAAGSMHYLATLLPRQQAALCALNIALLDGAAKKAGQPLYDFLKLGFREHRHVTSFSIGIDSPEVIRQKVLAAEK